MNLYPDYEHGSFTATGMNLAVGGLEPRPASDHIAAGHVPYTPPEKPSRWRRVLAWLGLSD